MHMNGKYNLEQHQQEKYEVIKSEGSCRNNGKLEVTSADTSGGSQIYASIDSFMRKVWDVRWKGEWCTHVNPGYTLFLL